jgi:hypothetical protein
MAPHSSLLRLCQQLTNPEPTDELQESIAIFVEEWRALGQLEVPEELLQEIQKLSPAGTAWMAIVFGALIENGAAPNQSGLIVIQLLDSWLSQLPVIDDDEGKERPELNKRQQELIASLPLLCQAAVAHIARLPELRQRLRDDPFFCRKLTDAENYSYGASWLVSLLERESGQLILIQPLSKKGFELRYENVTNCFHLFSLIQGVVGSRFDGAQRSKGDVLSVARGQGRDLGALLDDAWWHYGDPRSMTANIKATIWGEAFVSSIPAIEGKRVILLWPPILDGRNWGSDFFGPQIDAAPPDLIIEKELTATDVDSVLDQIQQLLKDHQ